MASATKSIQLCRSSQRIPPEIRKRSELSAAIWISFYVSTALLVVTTAMAVLLCLSVFDSAWGERFDRQRKS
jgi:hypothetical protein